MQTSCTYILHDTKPDTNNAGYVMLEFLSIVGSSRNRKCGESTAAVLTSFSRQQGGCIFRVLHGSIALNTNRHAVACIPIMGAVFRELRFSLQSSSHRNSIKEKCNYCNIRVIVV